MASNFFSRWSQRKLEGDKLDNDIDSLEQATPSVSETREDSLEVEQQPAPPVDEIESQIETATEQPEHSVASLLASEAEAAVKKAALRKLFLSGEFSEVDGLNDYDHDYKAVKSLSSDVAEKLRDWMKADDAEIAQDEQQPDEQTQTDAQQSLQHAQTQYVESVESEDETNQEVGQNIPHKQ